MTEEYQLRLLPQQAVDERAIADYIAAEHGFRRCDIRAVRVLRRSIDARQRTIVVNLKVRVYVKEEPTDDGYEAVTYGDVSAAPQVVVVGAGPAGLFAALRLIELGLRPVVVERGKDVHSRKRDLALIAKSHCVDNDSNYCFGEGGAGAYSDGKLYTRSHKRGNTQKILNVLCQHGASTAILADAHPHIGTDCLPRVIENIRNTIIRCGGEVRFQTMMTGLIVSHNQVVGITTTSTASANNSADNSADNNIDNTTDNITGGASNNTAPDGELLGSVILATGHSARDVYRHLYNIGVALEAKPLAVGVRLEHPAALIDRLQYHRREGRGRYLPAAEYSFVTQVDGRGVYSFCMCPGGFVIPAATGAEQLVVIGLSPSGRNGQWSNSGMVVEVRPDDVATNDTLNDPLLMLRFQEQLERSTWQQGNMRQTAPAQRMADFVNRRLSYDLPDSSYAPGLISSPLHFWMPPFVAQRLQKGFLQFGRQCHGFLTNEATVIAAETRTSAPVRIPRHHDTLQHIALPGLYPCGEGAGYAGGIVSAAVDGERVADAVAQQLRLSQP